jgi:hypothetical protein
MKSKCMLVAGRHFLRKVGGTTATATAAVPALPRLGTSAVVGACHLFDPVLGNL